MANRGALSASIVRDVRRALVASGASTKSIDVDDDDVAVAVDFDASGDDEPIDWRDVDWSKRLARWFTFFTNGTARWGSVTTADKNSQIDTSAHQYRYGIIVELTTELTHLLCDDDDDEQVTRLREAIDLMNLVLVAKPTAIAPVLYKYGAQMGSYDEELQAMARGVPVQLRLRLEYKNIATRGLVSPLLDQFLRYVGPTPALFASKSFASADQNLRRLALANGASTQLDRLATEAIRAVVVVDSVQTSNVSKRDGNDFFRYLSEFAANSAKQQQQQQPSTSAADSAVGNPEIIARAPLFVETIELRLRQLHVTPQVHQYTKQLVDTGIPVDCRTLSLDPRLIACGDETYQAFVESITKSATELIVITGGKLTEDVAAFFDERGEDRRDPINSVINAVARIARVYEINLGGLLKVCRTVRNRELIVRGLFEKILSRDSPVEMLTLTSGVPLTVADIPLIAKYAREWREANPNKKLHLQRIKLALLEEEDTSPLHALLSAFDDIENVFIWQPVSTPILVTLLRFPRIRSLSLFYTTIETMDIFDPTVADDRIPIKPALKELVLNNVVLRDPPSLTRLIQTLAPDPTKPHSLANSLQRLAFSQDAFGEDDEVGDVVQVVDNRTVEVLRGALSTNRVLQNLVYSIQDHGLHADKKRYLLDHGRHLPAPQTNGDQHSSEIVTARKVAFLSLVRGANGSGAVSGPQGLLDASLLRVIFDFSAPHILRRIQVAFTDY